MKTSQLMKIVFFGCFFISGDINANENNIHPGQNNISHSNSNINEATSDNVSVLENKKQKINEANNNPFSIALFHPTYILPFYYTGSPDSEVYQGSLAEGQQLRHPEFKAQISFRLPIFSHLFNSSDYSFDFAYTQLMYWQIYMSDAYFRESDYEPEVFLEGHFFGNALARIGLDHQSNGRGGSLERSWNRATATFQLSGNNWLLGLKAWAIVFKTSTDIHNPDIGHYLGYDNISLSYRLKKIVFSMEAQNIESGLKRGFIQASVSYPLWEHLSLYVQYFNGFGQSLIEYNHRTQSAGIGIAFNDWM